MRFRLTTVPSEHHHLSAGAFDDRASWLEALEDLSLESHRDLALDFRSRPSPALTVTSAFEYTVRILRDRGPGTVTCVVTNNRTARHLARLLPRAQRPVRSTQLNGTKIVLDLSNIVHVSANAVVNASNVELTLGGGVSDAIRRACADAGALQRAMHALAPIAKGETVVTGSFGLPNALWILHAATARGGLPIVEQAFYSVLQVAQARGFKSLAIPALGTGTGRLSIDQCAAAARLAIERLGFEGRITFALYDASALQCFERAFGLTATRFDL